MTIDELESSTESSSTSAVMELRDVRVDFSGVCAVRDVTMGVMRNRVTALIGPSGSGKTTLLRSLNRLHDLTHGAKVSGRITLDGLDIYDGSIPSLLLRSRIGMVFQRPNPFPGKSIYENVASGLVFNGIRGKALIDDIVEQSLRSAVLWDAVKDRLKQPATDLSGGEQQRMCIARALAVEPDILLMDEPTSALDPIATQQIEDLLMSLKAITSIAIVTHNMQQAQRTSDYCAFLLMGEDRAGELIEFDRTDKVFNDPADPRTVDYIAGRFG